LSLIWYARHSSGGCPFQGWSLEGKRLARELQERKRTVLNCGDEIPCSKQRLCLLGLVIVTLEGAIFLL
jgi:hypothetical protein